MNKKRHEYRNYLKSEAWQKRREQVIFRDGGQCQAIRNGRRCGSRYRLEVHHKHYMNFFREPLNDLITLCEYCHTALHNQKGTKHGKKN